MQKQSLTSLFSAAGAAALARRIRRDAFSIRVICDRNSKVYIVECRGRPGNKEKSVEYALKIRDCTGGKSSPMLCRMNGDCARVHSVRMEVRQEYAHPDVRLNDWSPVVTIPARNLQLARKGVRLLRFTVSVEGGVRAARSIAVKQSVPGFLDVQDHFPALFDAVWTLVAGVQSRLPHVSGVLTARAAAFMGEKTRELSADVRTAVEAGFQRILGPGALACVWEDAAPRALAVLRDAGDAAFRSEVLRFFFSVLIDDDEVEISPEQALSVYYEITVGAGEDMALFTGLVDRFLLEHDLSGLPPGCMLGLYPGMGLAAIKGRLTEEYKKWNARTTHSNPQIRARAKKMISLIASMRKDLCDPIEKKQKGA